MIRIDTHDTKQPMTLPAACEWLGRHTGKVPATSTVWRWALKGVRGGVRLECFRIGGTTYTTGEMICRFIERTSQTAATVDLSPAGVEVLTSGTPCRQGDQRREQIAAAHQRLSEICAPTRRGRQTNARR